MTYYVTDPETEIIKQPFSKLSQDARRFLGDHFPRERVAEIATILRWWRNRKILRHVTLDEYYEFGSIDRLIPHLRDVLELRGIADFEESCLSAWLIGILPISEGEQKLSNKTLLNVLSSSDELDANHFRHRFLGALGRTSLISTPIACFLMSWFSSLELDGPLFSHTGIEALFLILFGFIATNVVVSIPLFPFGFALSGYLDKLRQSDIEQFCIASLGNLGFVDSTCVLAQECLNRNPDRTRLALSALCKVLPNLSIESGFDLPKKTIPTLSKVLLRLDASGLFSHSKDKGAQEERSEEAMLLILNWFEIAGDSRALRAVMQVRKKARSEKIRERALSITPFLEECARLENDRTLLLRGSEQPLNKDELLIPATFSPDSKPEELLRPISQSREI